MIVGALQPHGSQNRLEALASPIHIAALAAARAGEATSGIVGLIGVQVSLQGTRRQPQGQASGCRLPGLEVDLFGGGSPDQGFDFLVDFGLEARLEPPFFTASAVSLDLPSTCSSAHCSQIFQY